MKTSKKKLPTLRVATRYYKTTNVNGELQFQIQQYTTAKLTPMHERIRNYYPAETRIGNVVNPYGLFSMFVVEKHIVSNDWNWAHEQAVKQYRAKRAQAVAARHLLRTN